MKSITKTFVFYFSIKPYNQSKNYYRILNVSQSATQTQIKKSFRELAKKYHPDSNKGKQEMFKQVNEAYQVLSDQTVKRQYDQVRTTNTNTTYTSASSNQKTYAKYNNSQSAAQKSSTQNYRGYQKQQGWKNMNFRDQFMYDLYRQQQAEQKKYQPTEKQTMQRQFRQRVQQALRKDQNQKLERQKQSIRVAQAELSKKIKQQYKKSQERQFQEYRKYRDQTFNDIRDKTSQKINKMAESVADKVKDVLKAQEHIQEFWNTFKNKNRKK